jgi:hypothetical protein
MPRTWKYRKGDVIVVNNTCDDKKLIGKIGTIKEAIQNISYDYRVEFNGEITKVMESEIDRLYFTPGNKVKYLINDEIVEVTLVDYTNQKIGIKFYDGSYAVVGLLQVQHIEAEELKPYQAFKNEDDTYAIPEWLLLEILKKG